MDPLSACWKSLNTPRWYIYHFRSRPKETWQKAIQRLFETIERAPIDLCVTNTSITLFRNDDPRPVHQAPRALKQLHAFLLSKPHRFQHVTRDPTRKTLTLKNYIRGVGTIDRNLWAEWICAGIFRMAHKHSYAVTDILTIGLRGRTFFKPRKRPPPHPLSYLFNTPKPKQWKHGTNSPSQYGLFSSRERSLSEASGKDIYGTQTYTLTRGTDSHSTLHIYHIRNVPAYGSQKSYSPSSPSFSP